MTKQNKITHCIWYNHEGEEAAKFYTSLFKNSEILNGIRDTKESAAATGNKEGDALTVAFRLENLEFMALNGGAMFRPTPAISFFINCETKEEVAYFWERLSDGGKVMMPLDEYSFSKQYGWVEDRFGLSWQVMLSNPEGDWRPKLIPCLLFTGKKSGQTKTARELYLSIFKNSEPGPIYPYEEKGQEDKTMFTDFCLAGQWIAAMDSPQNDPFDFTEGNSIVIHCNNQEEIDFFWDKLSENGGEQGSCGWLKDPFGISWQIIPDNISQLLKSPAAMSAMMKMKKLNIAELEQA